MRRNDKPKRWNLHPNIYMSPWGFISVWLNRFRNFVRAATHPGLLPPFTLKKYLQVMRVNHWANHRWRLNHTLLRRQFKKSHHVSVGNWGSEDWMKTHDKAFFDKTDLNADPNWQVKHKTECHDEAVTRIVAIDEDDRCDSDPPLRR